MGKINGGYIIVARKILDSEIMEKPPLYSKLWLWMLNQAKFKSGGNNLERGQFKTSINEMREAVSWKVGYRKVIPTSKEIRRAYEWLTKGLMVGTTKVTGGMIITILNYNKYQDPKNYEGHNEGHNERTAKGGTGAHLIIKKECKNDKNDIKNPLSPPSRKYLESRITECGFHAIKDQIVTFYNYRMSKPKAKQYQSEKGIDGLFRGLAECNESGLNLFDCLEIAMENNWQTIKPDYFKKNGGNNGTAKRNYTGKDNRPPVLETRLPDFNEL